MAEHPWLTQLNEQGYRLTSARERSWKRWQQVRGHSPPSKSMIKRGSSILPSVSLRFIARWRNSRSCISFSRVHQPQGCQAFISAGHGHQHLLLCQNCGQVAFFDGDDLDALTKSIARKTGYQINEHWLQLFGLCANCSAN